MLLPLFSLKLVCFVQIHFAKYFERLLIAILIKFFLRVRRCHYFLALEPVAFPVFVFPVLIPFLEVFDKVFDCRNYCALDKVSNIDEHADDINPIIRITHGVVLRLALLEK